MLLLLLLLHVVVVVLDHEPGRRRSRGWRLAAVAAAVARGPAAVDLPALAHHALVAAEVAVVPAALVALDGVVAAGTPSKR